MRTFVIPCLALCVGVAVGRMLDGVRWTEAAGGGRGGGVEECATQNGDVNADTFVNITDAIVILGSLFNGDPPALAPLCDMEGTFGLPDTGQTTCHDSTGAEIPCESASCPGQDGFHGGCPAGGRFIVDDGGTPADSRDDTVTDNCTGLMWQRGQVDVDGDGQVTAEDRSTWCAALEHCENLNLAGHDDWRLPNVQELHSLVDYGRSPPTIDPVFTALPAPFWSSTSVRIAPGLAWLVRFDIGHIGQFDKDDDEIYVRAVRGGR